MRHRSAGPADDAPHPVSTLPPDPPEPVEDAGDLWRTIVEQSPFSTVVYDDRGRLLAANDAFRRLWGVGLETAPEGYSVLEDPELERQGVLPLIRRAFAGETVVTPPVRYDISRVSTTGEGRTTWTQGHFYPVHGAGGRVTHVVLTHVDLTERVGVEEALRASERRFAALVRQAAVGIAQVDLAGRFTLVNDRYCELLGRTGEELMGLRMQDVTHPDDLPRNLPLFARAVETGEPFVIEKRYLRLDGSVVWVSNSVAAIRGEAGRTESILAVAFEVTARRRAMQHLQLLARAGEALSSSLDYAATLRNVAELVVPAFARWSIVLLQDEAGAQTPVATSCAAPEKAGAVARLARRLAELPPSERHLGRLALETREPQLVRDVGPALLDAIPDDAEYRRLVAALAPTSLLAVPLLAPERTLGVLICASDDPARRFDRTDVTTATELARRAAAAVDAARLYQAERAARAEAEQANRAKADFLAKMSHELRTPLNAIGGYADLLDMGVHGPVTGEQSAALERIRVNQRHLLTLITEILDFSKLEAGAVRLDVREVDAREVLAALEPLIGPQMRARGIAFEVLACEAPLSFRGDRDRVVQVCLNLLSNALRATAPGGRVVFGCEPRGDRVAFVVRDTGSGIPADRLEAIFSPFTQLGRALNNPGDGGVGLGLAISRELARAMQGDVHAESEVDRGSVFTLTLPRA